VYVADNNNHRIQKFDNNGNFIAAWGWGVDTDAFAYEICTSSCQEGNSGAAGGEEGAFNYPRDVAVDANDNVYVAEGNRIHKFDSNGNFLRMWGWGVDTGADAFEICTSSCEWAPGGSGAGQFDRPTGIGIDASGYIYVAEYSNHRIQKFDSSGAFVSGWGWGVDDGTAEYQICTVTCTVGISGGGDGQFSYPDKISVSSNGKIYIADTGNHRIMVFDNDGGFLAAWGSGVDDGTSEYQICTSGCQIGNDNDNEAGEFNVPQGIALDGADNVYVTDSSNSRVQKFTADGKFISAWGWDVAGGSGFEVCTSTCSGGATGNGIGQFFYPPAIEADQEGNVFVTSDSYRIQKFSPVPTNTFTLDDASPDDEDLIGDQIAFEGLAAATYVFSETILSGWHLDGISCTGGSSIISNTLTGILTITLGVNENVDCTIYNHIPEQSITIRKDAGPAVGTDFTFTTSISMTNFAEIDYAYLAEWGGGFGSGTNQFIYPEDIAVNTDGNVFVADKSNDRIKKYNTNGTLLSTLGSTGSGDGQLDSPWGVAVDTSGNLYVAEYDNHRVQKFDSEGNFLRMWGWGVDDGTAEFQVCTSGCQAGTSGSGAGQFNGPTKLTVDALGNVFVIEFNSNRIQKFDAGMDSLPPRMRLR
jgi:DNA-binding beta-propeller fold protein YncE